MQCSWPHCWLMVALFCLCVLTVPVYMLFMVAFVRQQLKRKRSQTSTFIGERPLSGAFFKLSFSVGIADLYHFFNTWLGMRRLSWMLPLYLAGGPAFAKFILAGAWVTRAAQGIGILCISINRYTTICWPRKAKGMWQEGPGMAVCLCAQWGTAVLFGVLTFLSDVHWKVDNATGQASPVFSDDGQKKNMFMLAAVLELFICPCIVVLYTLIVYKMVNQVRGKAQPSVASQAQPLTAAEKRLRRGERKLALCGLIICSQEIIWFLFLIYSTSLRLRTADFVVVYHLMGDLYASSNPWVLIAFSKSVRQSLLRTLALLLVRCGVTNARVVQLAIDERQTTVTAVTQKTAVKRRSTQPLAVIPPLNEHRF